MRTQRTSLAWIPLALALSSALYAQAAGAAFWGFNGSLGLQVAKLPPLVIPGAGTASLSGTSPLPLHFDTLALGAFPFAGTGLVQPITDPAAFPVAGLQATAGNLAGSFSGAPFGGVMPLAGVAKVCLFGACGSAGNAANLSVPLSVVGAGGTATVSGAGGGPSLTVRGAAWTTATAAVGTITAMGSPVYYDETLPTRVNSALVTLVTPIYVSTSLPGAEVVPMFASLFVRVVPEPTTLVLLGAGVAAFGLAGRRAAAR